MVSKKSTPVNKPTITSVKATLTRTLAASGKGFYYKATPEFTEDGREIRPLIAYLGQFNGSILGNPAQIVVTVAVSPSQV